MYWLSCRWFGGALKGNEFTLKLTAKLDLFVSAQLCELSLSLFFLEIRVAFIMECGVRGGFREEDEFLINWESDADCTMKGPEIEIDSTDG
jgi:hypothetical protein